MTCPKCGKDGLYTVYHEPKKVSRIKRTVTVVSDDYLCDKGHKFTVKQIEGEEPRVTVHE